MENLNLVAESGLPRVCTPGPSGTGVSLTPAPTQGSASPYRTPPTVSPATAVPSAPAGPPCSAAGPNDQLRPFVTQNGKTHPWKPRTPAQIGEFATLWRNPLFSVDQIARRYRCGKRTIQKWRTAFGLRPRDELMRLQEQGATVADAAGRVADDVHDAMRTMGEITRAQAVLGITLGLREPSAVDGMIVDDGSGHRAGKGEQWNPLRDAEVVALLEEIRSEARRITAHSDLTAIQRKLCRLSLLCSTKMPVHTWESLQALLDSLSRTFLSPIPHISDMI